MDDVEPENLTLDEAFLRAHKSMAALMSGSPTTPELTPSASFSTEASFSTDGESATTSTNTNTSNSRTRTISGSSTNSGYGTVVAPSAAHRIARRPRSPMPRQERVSFLEWSPSSSPAESDDDEYATDADKDKVRGASRSKGARTPMMLPAELELLSASSLAMAPQHHQTTSVPADAITSGSGSGGASSSSSGKPAGLPHQGPTSPSFWLVADPSANPLAREGADEALPVDEDIDVVVIGSGITGVSFLLHLVRLLKDTATGAVNTERGFNVVMLEARDFCSGATGRNGGHFTPSIFDDFVERSSSANLPNPIDDAVRVSKLEQHTLNSVASLIHSQNWAQEVDFVQEGHIKLFLTDDEENVLRADYEAAKAAGVPVEDVRWISKEEMKVENGADRPGVWYPASNVWPIKLVTRMFGLARETAAASSESSAVSIRLHTHTVVTDISPIPSPSDGAEASSSSAARWTVQTDRGALRTRYVIHATNGYASHLLPQLAQPADLVPVPSSISQPHASSSSSSTPASKKPRAQWIAPTRGQVIATRANVPPSQLWRSSWLANWGYEYWFPRYWFPRPPASTSSEGVVGDEEKALIILGGARDEARGTLEVGITDDSTVNPYVSAALRAFLPETFPGLFEAGTEPEYEWTGVMAYTKTLDPMVGPVPAAHQDTNAPDYLQGQYIAAGYSGHGMPRAYACAEAIAQMVIADLRGEEWQLPEWMPPSYLTF